MNASNAQVPEMTPSLVIVNNENRNLGFPYLSAQS
jgi:hypothetical protein